MQKELTEELPGSGIAILGVNEAGQESQNDLICEGRDLPWLQETASDPIWDLWHVTYRDVIIVDANNEIRAVYNLTEHSLSNSANFGALKELLVRAGDKMDGVN